MKTTIDASGRIQLTDGLQAQLGVKPGDEIVIEKRAGEWVIKSELDKRAEERFLFAWAYAFLACILAWPVLLYFESPFVYLVCVGYGILAAILFGYDLAGRLRRRRRHPDTP